MPGAGFPEAAEACDRRSPRNLGSLGVEIWADLRSAEAGSNATGTTTRDWGLIDAIGGSWYFDEFAVLNGPGPRTDLS